MRRRDIVLSGLLASMVSRTASAKPVVFGINAEVSYRETEADVRHRYGPFLDHVSQVSGTRVQFKPVYSDQVTRVLTDDQCDLMLLHTHAALQAERDRGWQLVGVTEDRGNDVVHFFVRPDSQIQDHREIPSHPVGSPGMQSWAVATARSMMRQWAPGTKPTFVTTKLQDAVPLMVELKRTPVGISRSKKLVADYVRQQRLRVVYSTKAMPLNAIIASPDLAPDLIEKLRNFLGTERNPEVFEDLGFTGIRYSDTEARRLRTFYA